MNSTAVDIIILVGNSGVGKDLCSTYLSNKLNWPTYALATPVKQMASIAFNLPIEYFNDRDKKEIPVNVFGLSDKMSPRQMMQMIYKDCFTEVVNKYLPNIAPLFFIYNMENKFNLKGDRSVLSLQDKTTTNLESPIVYQKLILSDFRNPIYIEYLQLHYKCLTIKLIRPGIIVQNHISEKEVNDVKYIDYVVNNDSTIDDLYIKLDKILINANLSY